MPAASDSPVILQVLPALQTGGVERGTVEITQAITRAEGVALVASAGGRMVPMIAHAGGRHIAMPLDSKNPVTIWRNAERLAALIRAERVGIVHARSRAPAWSAWLACRRTGARFVTTYHGAYSENAPFKRWYNSVMARGEIVIVASRFIADLVHARHGVPEPRIRLIPRGVDPAVFDPALVSPDRIARLARAWRLPDGLTTIVLPGRLTAWKGHATVLDAVARLGRNDLCCVFVGSDQGRARYSESLRQRAEALGIAERVRLVGECDDMPAAYRLSDVVVHASTQPEAFGRVVIEAQAMARPVIAADLGGPVETVIDGETGWRVRPGDPEALAGAIARVLAMPPAHRLALGAQARALVPTVEAMRDATLRVYAEVLGI
jgi:glycosyltransferase involved in cell wall biosynthesis